MLVNMKIIKKILSLCIATVMLAALCPAAFATGTVSFSDVETESVLAEAALYLNENSPNGVVVNGVGGGRLLPDGAITTAQLVTFIARMEGADGDYSAWGNGLVNDGWSVNSIAWARAQGLITSEEQYSELTVEQVNDILTTYCKSCGVAPAVVENNTRGAVIVSLAAVAKDKLAGAFGVLTGTQKAYVEAEDWGPVVSKTVIALNETVDVASVKADDFSIIEKKESYVDFVTFATGVVNLPRTITDAYTSDADGNRIEEDSNYLTIEMAFSPNEGCPFIYKMAENRTAWSKVYGLTISLGENSGLTSNGKLVTALNVSAEIDIVGDGKICPATNGWDTKKSFVASNGEAYRYAVYTPKKDDTANPLVIWLHGGGECGEDPQISILANKVTALSSDEFQKLVGGAYILAPQAPTGHHWCNGSEGDIINGVETYGNGTSIFLDSLFELIDTYVNSNPDIDPDKILIGGCSAGGYMTVAQIIAHPDYFAAAFPISQAYYSAYLTDEEIGCLGKTPIWFTNAKNDSINPDLATNAVIERLEASGAVEVHHSVFEDVHDTSGLYTNEDGSPYQYSGHFSWIYFDNNECEENGLNAWEWLASKV